MNSKIGLGFLCAALALFSCCTRMKTDSYPLFLQVKRDVAYRSGETIHWSSREYGPIRDCIEQRLAQPLTVDDVIEVTLLNNKRLQALYESLGLAQADFVQAGLLKNPILDYQLRFNSNADKVIEVGILQDFLDILLKPLKTKVAHSELEIVKDQVTGDVMEVIAEAKIAFYTLQAAEEAFALNNQMQEATEAAFDMAKRLYEAGNIHHLEWAIERSAYEQSKIDLIQSQMEVVDAKERLNQLMGLWGTQINWELTKEVKEIPDEIFDCEEIENSVVANSLDLRLVRAQIRLTAAKNGIDRVDTLFPAFGVGVDSERESDGSWFVGPQFTVGIPLFDFGQAQTAAGRAELNQLYHEYCALEIELRSAARSARFRLWNAHRQGRHFKEVLVPLTEEITAETMRQLNAMQLGLFDLLLAKQREIQIRAKAVQSYREYWIAHTDLELLRSGRMAQKMRRKQ